MVTHMHDEARDQNAAEINRRFLDRSYVIVVERSLHVGSSSQHASNRSNSTSTSSASDSDCCTIRRPDIAVFEPGSMPNRGDLSPKLTSCSRFTKSTRMDRPAGSINLHPNKPEPYDGKRDYLIVHTWLYKVDQYLTLMEITNPTVGMTEQRRIMYASTFLSGMAAVWWYTLVKCNQGPVT